MGAIPVVDVFAGPGGLNEGFSGISDQNGRVFKTVASIEMDKEAVETLRLRAAFRKSIDQDGGIPAIYQDFVSRHVTHDQLISHPTFKAAWDHALAEVHQHELSEDTRDISDELVESALKDTLDNDEPWVLIGGPPCQAYSLVGRSRRKHDLAFKDDHKHTLYREYLHLIERFRPHVFVMENVKGLLSSQHGGGPVFKAIESDLTHPAADLTYVLRSCVVEGDADALSPSDFIVRAEKFGVPQARHRVILLGFRSDIDSSLFSPLTESPSVSVESVIGDMPKIRSGVSPRSRDNDADWTEALRLAGREAEVSLPRKISVPALSRGHIGTYTSQLDGDLGAWISAHPLTGISQHESRHHMDLDLARYAFLAFKLQQGKKLHVGDLPPKLRPKHSNLDSESVPFTDRFRVQAPKGPSTTVTSHISKDGHYFIHYDPLQMRSLTVREAARLQTFPDNYFFMGGRTKQYHQVGNAVPPFLARQIGEIVAKVLGRASQTPR
ncbi:DNA cytosine methyltransferase [Terrabacter sp. MAHUQ-38]|uniref:DNA cytosine methyltransferase n=1 Tax=unclassified Terrabacter TaxID=2630222 RepID=UPI00165DB586|nr:DNA cytosine methyltransferase [Terrabacter sp. MAHUQ-38]MBC9819731.1 DNA cytosine methyltransferase [Terrabacter sp. MAHUQ-38]